MMSSRVAKLIVPWVTLCLCLAVVSPAWGQRKLGTVGPPPRQDPQRQTGGEGMPPLPLPAVPLRRSEPKAQPSPPVFIARLAYGDNQDYMPNPGDLDNLLRHVRAQLDAWYGQTIITADELASLHAQGKRVDIPMIYVTGYEAFTLTDPQRAALRDYLLDGGTLLADATLGSVAFAESFTSELAKMFPQRRLEPLQVDHPAFRGYYPYTNVGYFTVDDDTHSRRESPPQFLGLNIAARTAVIFSPYDMTCGWDEFYAPPAPRRGNVKPKATAAMMPADAIRMGINLVAYISAQRNFAKVQATTRQIDGTQPQQRAQVKIGLLRHQGDWNPDPNSIYQLIRFASLRTSVPVAYELSVVDANLSDLADTPILIMTGMDEPRLDDQQLAVLRRHLAAGGFLFVNNTSGYAKFDRYARAMIQKILPEHELEAVPADHELFSSLYQIDQLRQARTGEAKPAELEAVVVDGRAVIVYSPNDTLGMLKGVHDPYANAYDAASSQKLALNILCYALKH